MPRHRPVRRGCGATLRLAGSVLLVGLYLWTITPLGSGLTAVLALLDRTHHVLVRETCQGVEVVLQHGLSSSGTHRHGWVAGLLAAWAQPTDQSHPDHVLPFDLPQGMETPATCVAVGTAPSDDLVELAALAFGEPRSGAALDSLWSEGLPRPPPWPCERQRALRSVILLI